nr:hypothetical protein [Tanacetum cinerariifolium]
DKNDSIDKLFDEGNDDVSEETIARDASKVAAEKTKKKRKRKVVGDASGSSFPPKRIREDHPAAASNIGESLLLLSVTWFRMVLVFRASPAADVPVTTVIVTTTVTTNAYAVPPPKDRVVSKNLKIFRDSASAGGANADAAGTSKLNEPADSSDSFYASQDLDSETLRITYYCQLKVNAARHNLLLLESSNEKSLGEDASKQERIEAIDADEDITMVNVQADAKMFNADKDLGGEEDKDKGIMVEEPVKHKKKDQIRLDEEATLKLQAEFDEEQRLARERERERAQKEQEANIALIETWDDVQAKIDVDHQLAERLEEEQQQELIDEEKATFFITELVQRKEKEKRAGEELIQKRTKKQNVEDDKKTAKLKQLMKIILDKEKVAIDATPLAVKSLGIVDWKIHKERKKIYYQNIRDDGKSKMYMFFSQMLKSFDREDLEDLYKLVFMLVEETYLLTPSILTMMPKKKLQSDYYSEMAYQLLKLIRKQLKK